VIDPKNIESFDSLFKQAFDGVKTPAPEGLWENIAASTTGSAAAGTGIVAKLLGIKGAAIITGAVVLTTTVAVLYFNQPKTDDIPNTPVIEETLTETEANNQNHELLTGTTEEPSSQLPHSQQTVTSGSATSADANNSTQPQTAEPENLPNTGGNLPPSSEVKPTTPTPENTTPVDQHQSIPTEAIITTNSEHFCLNQEVKINLECNKEVSRIKWFLNQVFVGEQIDDLTLILTHTGVNTVKAVVDLKNGNVIERSKTLLVDKMSAGFTYKVENQNLQLLAENMSASHIWYINNRRLAQSGGNIVVAITETKGFEVIHISGNLRGCTDTATQTISMANCDFQPKIPQGFSPHLIDGLNDEWVIDMPVVERYYLVIFASDKNIVFETFDQKTQWNGKRLNNGDLLPVGTYTYQLVYECDGNSAAKSGKLVIK